MTACRPEAVLFDLDGTLVDTAPDLLAAVNRLRAGEALPPAPLAGFRSQVSRGARAMLAAGIPAFAAADADRQADWVARLLAEYARQVCRDSVLFPGMAGLLEGLRGHGIALAVVTNKPERMAVELLAAMGLAADFPVVLGGDSLAERKPHPLPVLTACERLGVAPQATWFLGDDARDVEAGRAAGSLTVAVTWGYADPGEIAGWRADRVIDDPAQALAWLQ
ncbi:MAG: phosphoglycolate phosphatase [Xanthomonadales bacterium]|nr:phosphoglycolate phosphatase [Xanthomonadales bacterium]